MCVEEGGRAQKFQDGCGAGGLAALEAMAAGMRLEAKCGKLDGENVRVLRAVLRRPRVAGRLVTLVLS